VPFHEHAGVPSENLHVGKGLLDFWFVMNSYHSRALMPVLGDLHRYSISPHRASWQYFKAIGAPIEYVLYRGRDHEMIRRWKFGSEE